MNISEGWQLSSQILFMLIFGIYMFYRIGKKNKNTTLNKFPMTKYFVIFMYAIFVIALASMHLEKKTDNTSSNNFALVMIISNVIIVLLSLIFAYNQKNKLNHLRNNIKNGNTMRHII